MRKKWIRKIMAVTVTAVLTSTMIVGCGNSTNGTTAAGTEAGGDKTYKIGVFQYQQHPALDQANEGFVKALEESGLDYTLDQQNASGDPSTTQTIAQKMVNDRDDLIFAIATPAAQAVAALTKDIPTVVTAVTDPEDSGLIASNEAPGGNITGTSDLNPVKKQVELLKQLIPDAKKVGVLYCSAEANSKFQVELVKEACKEQGLEAIDFTVSNSNEIQTVVESMVGKVDVIYAPTDNVISNAMATVSMVATENKLPIIAGEENQVTAGALATYSVDYEMLGYKAGEMAVEILKGEKQPGDIPIGYLAEDEYPLVVNDEVAAKLGIDTSVVEIN